MTTSQWEKDATPAATRCVQPIEVRSFRACGSPATPVEMACRRDARRRWRQSLPARFRPTSAASPSAAASPAGYGDLSSCHRRPALATLSHVAVGRDADAIDSPQCRILPQMKKWNLARPCFRPICVPASFVSGVARLPAPGPCLRNDAWLMRPPERMPETDVAAFPEVCRSPCRAQKISISLLHR